MSEQLLHIEKHKGGEEKKRYKIALYNTEYNQQLSLT